MGLVFCFLIGFFTQKQVKTLTFLTMVHCGEKVGSIWRIFICFSSKKHCENAIKAVFLQLYIINKMALKNSILKITNIVLKPITTNFVFFCFMFGLGMICQELEKHYDWFYWELFLDLYIVCAFLAILPKYLRKTLRILSYLLCYITSITDVYCFTKFGSSLSPTILSLLLETDTREASEFISSCLSADLLFSKVGDILLLLAFNLLFIGRKWAWRKLSPLFSKHITRFTPIYNRAEAPTKMGLALTVLVLLSVAGVNTAHNKALNYELMSSKNIGEVEHFLTRHDKGYLYVSPYRLAFSIYANTLVAQQLDRLTAVSNHLKVDSCAFTSPEIVLIIGESYNRHHSAQYGYAMPTTPRQIAWQRKGRLIPFTDVVSPWNLTSYVFKHVFTTYTVGDKGEWCDYPLFPQLFRQAGYHVTFITNQFLPKSTDAVYDFSGGFFLNDSVLSAKQFDARNKTLHTYDESLLSEYDSLKLQQGKHNLTIFHLIGQHVTYKQRSPNDRKKFKDEDYVTLKPNHSNKERRILSDYDNAILYNDSIVDQIVRRFIKKEAIVIYMPDHGEECYEGDMHFFCRLHSNKIDARLAHAEFDIPFWIWFSNKYAVRHPNIIKQIKQARHKRYMTDALSHMLLYLAGIKTSAYKEEYNILSPAYNEQRKRLLKHTTDYDTLK